MHATIQNPDGPIIPRGRFRSGVWVILLAVFIAGCNREDLVRVDSEKEANRILVELALNNIQDARVETSGDRKSSMLITVPHEEMNKAREVLVRENLPREHTGGFQDMVNQTSLIPSATDDRAKLIFATTSELEKTFEAYDGVVEAHVHVVMPEHDSMRVGTATQPMASSAMVLIKCKEPPKQKDGNLTNETEDTPGEACPTAGDVRKMVAGSVEGVQENNVEVHFTKAAKRDFPTTQAHASPWYSDNSKEGQISAALLGVGIGIILTLMGFYTWRMIGRSRTATRDLSTATGSVAV